MPKVSVIIPVFNGAKSIERSINSLKAQTLNECEFIFVDDCSTDNTVEKLEALTQNDRRFIILKQEKHSDPFQSRKRGVITASGEYIMFLDADDEFIPEACEIAYKTISKKNVDLVLMGSIPVKTSNTSSKVLNGYRNYLKFEDKIRGFYRTKQECFKLYFKEAGFGFTTSLAKKIFKTKILKQALSTLNPELYLGYGQDLYQLIATMTYIDSLYADNKLIIHKYYIGDGVTQLEHASISIEKYKRIVSSANTFKAIQDFITKAHLSDSEKTNALTCAKKSLLASAQKHLWLLEDKDLALGIAMLYNAWGSDSFKELPFLNNFSRFKKFILENPSTPETIKFDLYKTLPAIMDKTIEAYTNEISVYKNSASYKIGYIITAPIRWLNRLFS